MGRKHALLALIDRFSALQGRDLLALLQQIRHEVLALRLSSPPSYTTDYKAVRRRPGRHPRAPTPQAPPPSGAPLW